MDGPNDAFPDDAAQGNLGREIEPGVFFGIDKHVLSALPYRSQATRPKLGAGRRHIEQFDVKVRSVRTTEGEALTLLRIVHPQMVAIYG